MEQHQVSAGGIVVKKTPTGMEVLLIKDRFGFWTWPKGHLEEGEDAVDAAVRETREETGISDLRVIAEIGKQEYSFSAGDLDIFKTVSVFLMESGGKEKIKAQVEEISSAAWFPSDEALQKIGYEGSAAILKRAIEKFQGREI